MQQNLSTEEFQSLLNSKLPRLTKLLIILYWNNKEPKSLAEIRQISLDNGLREPLKWNISDILSRIKGQAILIKGKWSITIAGTEFLHSSEVIKNKKGKPNYQIEKKENDHFDVAIIAALYDDEYTSLKEFLEEETPIAGFETMVKAKLKGSDKIVLVDFQTRMGMVEATYLSTQILAKFSSEIFDYDRSMWRQSKKRRKTFRYNYTK